MQDQIRILSTAVVGGDAGGPGAVANLLPAPPSLDCQC